MATPETVEAPVRPDDITEEVPIVEGDVEAMPPRRFWRKRNIVIVVVAVVVAAGAGIGIWLGTSGSSSSLLEVTTQVVSVTTGTMQQTVAASGTIEPAQQADLNFGVSGSVTAVNVAAGQKVTAGQVLATVNPSALQATLDAAQATLASAQAKLSSDQSANASTSQIDSDQASVTSAQSQLTTAQTNLADASLTSTIAGTVASVDLTVGQQVSGSSGSSAASSSSTGSTGSTDASSAASSAASSSSSSSSSSGQIVVISTDSFVVSTTVDDTQVGEIVTGDQAVITPSGATTNIYGTVSSVGLVASSSSTVATFPVSITVTGSPTGIYAGSSATISIIVKQLNNVTEVPTAAISYSGGQATVTKVVDGRHVSQAVTTGESSGGDTQITKGLSSGDKVVERVVKFNAGAATGGRSLLGGSTTGGFGGGAGGFTRGGEGAGGFGGEEGGGGFTRGGGFGG